MQTLLTAIGILCLLLFAPKADAHHGEAGMSLLERPQKPGPDATSPVAREPANASGFQPQEPRAKIEKRKKTKPKRKPVAAPPVTAE